MYVIQKSKINILVYESNNAELTDVKVYIIPIREVVV